MFQDTYKTKDTTSCRSSAELTNPQDASLSTPPTPPPLPVFNLSSSKVKAKQPGLSSGDIKFATLRRQHCITMATPAPIAPFTPCYLFFYGSLQDEDVLRAISGTTSTPKLRACSIRGYGLKLWSVYPTLVPKADGKVVGKAWWCESEAQFAALQRYETKAYTWAFCAIEMEDGDVVKEGRVFVWAGEPDSGDLTDGVFDLETWQTNWKPNLFGR